MQVPGRTRGLVRFPPFELDAHAGELHKNGQRIRLQDKPLQILLMLLERPGEAVTREELRQKLWPDGTFVDFDHGLNTAVKKLRQALDDDPETPEYIETIPRRGYRFIAPVRPVDERPATQPQPWFRRRLLLALLAGFLVATVALWRYLVSGPIVPSGEPALRRLAVLDSPYAKLSPDGMWLAFQDGRRQHLRVRNLRTGETRSLVEEPVAPWFAWFADSQRLVFARVQSQPLFRLESVDVRNAQTQMLWQGKEDDLQPIDVAQDGSLVLVAATSPASPQRRLGLLALSAAGNRVQGSLVTLSATANPATAGQADLSPDGQWVVYQDVRGGNAEIYLVSTNGGNEIPIASHPAIDSEPFFSADGNWILFWSYRRGWGDLWAVRFHEGPAVGAPQLAYPDIDLRYFASISHDNSILVTGWRHSGRVDVLPVDPDTGVRMSSSATLTSFGEDTFSPFWGIGAGELFSLTRHAGRTPIRLVATNLATGKDSEIALPPSLPYLNGASLSPDGRTLVSYAETLGRQAGLFTYSLTSKQLRAVAVGSQVQRNTAANWSPDGTKITFGLPEGHAWAVRTLDLTTGAQRTIARSQLPPNPSWSPDGTAIAFRDLNGLAVAPWQGGERKNILQFPTEADGAAGGVEWPGSQRISWSPDGNKLACVVNNLTQKREELWIVNYPEGTYRSILSGEADYETVPRSPVWSPDGRYIAFTWAPKPEYEISVLTNVLPLASASH